MEENLSINSYGGAIYFESIYKISQNTLSYINNSAVKGGAIYIESTSKLKND